MNQKPTNPKDAIGVKKVSPHYVPAHIRHSVSLAMQEGGIKYGSYNYRVAGVKASIYYDALIRHIDKWWDEGEDFDPDTNNLVHQLDKAMACLVVLKDAIVNDKLTDDRPPKSKAGYLDSLNKKAAQLIDSLPPSKEAFTELGYKTSELYKEVNAEGVYKDALNKANQKQAAKLVKDMDKKIIDDYSWAVCTNC